MCRVVCRVVASVVVALFVLLTGCGPAKELPEDIPRPESPSGAPEAAEPTPKESEPAARAVLDRALDAIAGGKTERLKKLRVCVLSYQGSVSLPTSPVPTPATLRWEIAWPDRARTTYDLTGTVRQTFILRGKFGWRTQEPVVGDLRPFDASPLEIGRIITTELSAQMGVILGLTLSDPQAVAYDTTKTPDGTVVKLKLRELPVLQITFSEATGVPTKVEYHPREYGQKVNKVLFMTDHKDAEGYLLPRKLEFHQNGRLGEQWTLDKWEFPEKLDDSRFEPPKL
jgi:hypothetical protein